MKAVSPGSPGQNALLNASFLKAACFAIPFGMAVAITFAGGSWSLLRKAHGLPPISTEVIGAETEEPAWWQTEAPDPAHEEEARADSIAASPASIAPEESPAALVPSAGTQLSIPRIELNAAIVEVRLSGGEWSIPRSVVGHLSETAQPGDVGNAVFAGHLVAGERDNVFARLSEVSPGDEVGFAAGPVERRFRVTEKRLVRNTDMSVLTAPADARLVTLITCAGQWIPSENDYDQRLVVIAETAA